MITCSTNKLQKVLLSGRCEQNGTPTPDNPIDIICNNGVIKASKNLFDVLANPLEQGGVASSNGENSTNSYYGRVRTNGYIPVKPSTTYTASVKDLLIYYLEYAQDTTYTNNHSTGFSNNSVTITTGVNTYFIRLQFRKSDDSNIRPSEVTNVQLEQGSIATPYHSYGEIYTDGTVEQVTDSLGNTANAERLLAVGDYKDMQEVLNGSVTRNVGIKVLDGTEGWDDHSSIVGWFQLGESLVYAGIAPALCTHYPYRSTQGSAGVCFSTGKSSSQRSRIIIMDNVNFPNTGMVTEFKQFLATQYANGTPVIIVYPLATPTTEQVTSLPLAGSSATVTAGSIDNLPIETSTVVELKKRYVGNNKVGRVFIGSNKIWETDDWYGIRWCEETDVVERIGNPELHKTLPLQSQMRRCMLQDDGTVYKYISSTNPLEYEDGTTAHYDGTDGQVMVEIPAYYHESGHETIDNKQWNYIKLYPDVRLGVTSRKCYIGAFELIQDNATNSSAKGCSVSVLDLSAMLITTSTTSVNAVDVQYLSNASTYRNYNYANTDTTSVKCSYGRPTTNRSRATFRGICARRGANWSLQTWDAYNSLLRLYFVEYANFNSQATFNSTLTDDGYRQGGLGSGVTNVTSADWNTFNGRNPFVPSGITIGLGNNSGYISYVFATDEWKSGASLTTYVNSYRGIELPFGHIWKFIDGFNRQGGIDENEAAIEKIYICNDVSKFAENAATGYTLISLTTPRATGDIGGIVLDKEGTFWPKPDGYTRYSDYFYNNYANGSWYTLYAGGVSANGSNAGLLYFAASNGASYAIAYIGARLLYTNL